MNLKEKNSFFPPSYINANQKQEYEDKEKELRLEKERREKEKIYKKLKALKSEMAQLKSHFT